MNAGEFARKRARITTTRGRSEKWKRKAISHLAREAGAVEFVHGGKVKSHRLNDGRVLCVKHRYRTEGDAADDLARIAALPGTNQKPVRHFHCPHCQGFHLTHLPPVSGRK